MIPTRVMYIITAKRAGPMRINEFWTTKGMRRYCPVGELADVARQAHPMNSPVCVSNVHKKIINLQNPLIVKADTFVLS
jgi:hypothetical protein